MSRLDRLDQELPELIELRRHLHAHPELSGEEHQTAALVAGELRTAGWRVQEGVGRTGVLAERGPEDGPTVGLRVDMDALPVEERTGLPHASIRQGVMHACGHDLHTCIGLGVARLLGEGAQLPCRVRLLFQPAEETGTGAAAVLNDPVFDRFAPDFAVAIHNMPGFPMHAMVVKSGSITAAVRSVVVRFTGRVAHASEPEKGENPSFAVADLLRDANTLVVADQHDPHFRLVTPVHVSVGSVAYGVAAGDGEVHFTIRSASNEGLSNLQAEITAIAEQLAVRDGLAVEIDVVEDFYANINDPEVTERVRRAAETCGLEIITPDVGMRAGEDFGLFTERFPCCLVLLGAGEDHLPIHNAAYDFPDELIATGVELFEQIVRDAEGNFEPTLRSHVS